MERGTLAYAHKIKGGRVIMKKLILGIILGAAGFGAYSWYSMDSDTRALVSSMPTKPDVLFWTQDQRDAGFRAIDKLSFLAEARPIKASGTPRKFEAGAVFKADLGLDSYMKAQRTAGIVILHKGKLREERYGLGFDSTGKWTSFSVAKSFTSTLVGAAIKDGFIKSINDPVTNYIPDLKGSAYDGVSVEQLLMMSSGVRWNENYTDPKSDVAQFNTHTAEAGRDVTVSYLRKLPRAAKPGTRWNYNTGETNLIGVLVSKATGKTVSQYLQEKIWTPYGMEQDGSWLLGSTGHEISGCCIQASTRDFARMGQFMLGDVQSIVPEGWVAKATVKQKDTGSPGEGYGYQWWTYDDGSYAAQGIFGQGIFIDPKRQLVIATNGNWPSATNPVLSTARDEFYRRVQAAVDAE
jgi:CubicO group peptidase (beta-lactamase class C family)